MKRLYYGDNLQVLRENIPDECIDLIYLDPPFNSNANYNVLFKNATGERSEAQITAFEDTWTWGIESERFLDEIKDIKGELYQLLDLLVRTLGKNSLSAYLVMMTIRLIELHRVLKSSGSLYLHCDPTASHYLKMILDIIFQAKNFLNEVCWKRSSAHNDTKQGMKRYGKIRDLLLVYTKSNSYTWNPVYTPYNESYLKKTYNKIAPNGRRFTDENLTAAKAGGDTSYEWRVKKLNNGEWEADIDDEYLKPKENYEYKAVVPYNGRYWAYSKENMIEFAKQGKLFHRRTGVPRLMNFADEMPGIALQDLWIDIPPGNKLGYPTEKPQALLERIIQVSSNKGDIVLDPFCGCGTAIHAAENLGRNWIGIDITHLAIALIEKRLRDAFPNKFIEDENKNQKLVPGIEFEVEGTPKDLAAAEDLFTRDPYQFQWWACSLVNAQPYKDKKKGADGGIDGLIFFEDVIDIKKSNKTAVKRIIVSVKGGKNINASMIRDLRGTMETNKSDIGLFVTLTSPTQPMIKEAASSGFYKAGNGRSYAKVQILTIEELLTGQKRPEFFDMKQGELTFKKAQRENRDIGEQGELF